MFSDDKGLATRAANALIVAASLLSVSGGSVFAQGQGSVDQRLLACSAIEDTAERAACFDDAVKAMQQTAPAPAAEAAPSATTEATTVQPASVPAATAAPAMQIEKEMDDPDEFFGEFTATIIKSSKSGLYHFIVELDNGQVWEETDGSRRPGLPKVGQTVRVTEGRLGGYRMKIGSANKLSWVRRLK